MGCSRAARWDGIRTWLGGGEDTNRRRKEKERGEISAEGGFSSGGGRPCGGYSDEREGGGTVQYSGKVLC